MFKIKKVTVLISILALFLICTDLLSYGEENQEKQEKVKVRLVWKRAYGDKLIPDRNTFPPPEIQTEIKSDKTSEAGKQFLINTLRAQVAKHDRLVFFEGGKVMDVKKEGYAFIYFSPNGEYIGFGGGKKGMTEEEFSQADPFAGLMTQLILMTKEGEFLWRKITVPDGINVFDNGEVAVSNCPEFSMSPCFLAGIYDRKGNLILDYKGKKKDFMKADSKEKPIFPYWEPRDNTLLLFAAGGKVVSKIRVKDLSVPTLGFITRWVILSDNGKNLSLNGIKSVQKSIIPGTQLLMDDNGKIIREFSFEFPTKSDFSPDGNFLAIIDNMRSLYFIESSTGNILWQNPEKNNENYLWSVQVSDNGEFVLLSGTLASKGEGRGGRGSEMLLNKNGEILWRERLGLADVSIARDGSYFFIAAPDSLYCYAIDK